MGVKIITAPSQVISRADAKLHLRIDDISGSHPDDALVDALVTAAHGMAEHYTGYAIGSQTLELALDEFPSESPYAIELPRGKVTSITSLKYIDEDEVETTIASSNYTLDDYSIPCWLLPDDDYDWPTPLTAANVVKVRYVAGDLPAAVKSALLLTIGFLYENRGSENKELPMAAKALLDTIKVYSR